MTWILLVLLVVALAVATERAMYWYSVAQEQSRQIRKQWQAQSRMARVRRPFVGDR